MTARGTGALLDDGSYEGVSGAYPSLVGAGRLPDFNGGVADLIPTVRDQGSRNSCVGHAMASAIYCLRKKASEVRFEPPSAGGLWFFARSMRDNQDLNVGCSPGDMFRAIAEHGVPAEADYAMGTSHWVSPDQEAMLRAAESPRVAGVRLSDNDSIREALIHQRPVLLTIRSDDGYQGNTGLWNPKGEFRGYHEVLGVRYNPVGVVTMGSYGRGHGVYGMTTIPWSVIDSDAVVDPWAVVEAP